MIKQLLVKSTKENKKLGSSTVCVLILDNKKNELYSGYLGDSCYLIARPKGIGNFELFFKSEEQTHGFNIPFQVGSEGDNPNTAITLSHKLKRNDLILAATDGLWDNMEADDILKEINYLSAKTNTLEIDTDNLSKIISQRAEELSMDTNHYSPFARKAIENKYRNFQGGKPDDITVIVAQVRNEDKNKESILFSSDSQSEDKNKENILSGSESQSTAETSCEDNISASDDKIFF
jgi:protein phosphatase PTC7